MRFALSVCLLVLALVPVMAEQQIDPPKNEPDWYENDDRNFLPLGIITRQQILGGAKVYNFHYVEYAPKSDPVEAIYNVKQPVEIKAFFGDWCKDSKTLIPALIKTMEFAGNNTMQVTYINMSPDKKNPPELLAGWNIEKVPTIVVMNGEREIGRIIESPATRIEEDLAQILTKLNEPGE